MTVSEWADLYAKIPQGAEPGAWRTLPYQRAIMDAFSEPQIARIVVQKSKQVGWTSILGHVIGYHIHQDPCSILLVQPTIEDAEGYSKEDLVPMFDATPALRALVAKPRAKDSASTILRKTYPGGMLHLIGANSPRGFRRIRVRIALFDEPDGYPPTAGQEGDQIRLGTGRTETFWNRKIALGSTPTVKGASRIEAAMDRASVGEYILACPHCQIEHVRRFDASQVTLRGDTIPVSFMQWPDGQPAKAAWACPGCGVLIGYEHHKAMIEAGSWRGEHWEHRNGRFTFLPGFSGHIGFRIWAGYSYSPNATPADLVSEYLEVKDRPDEYQTFVNTVLGELWTERGEEISEQYLLNRVEHYTAEAPAGVRVPTCGVDKQRDRLELEVVGWGPGEESWSIDYQILWGDTTQPEVWRQLAELLQEHTYEHESGAKLPIAATCIDSGDTPRAVYDFVRDMRRQHIYAIKGVAGAGRPVIEPAIARARRLSRLKAGSRPELVGVDEAKTILYQRLRQIQIPGPGYCHFPAGREAAYFKGLCSEKLVTRYKMGRSVREWIQIDPRNEPLDARNYAYAALKLLNPRLDVPILPPRAPIVQEPTASASRGRPDLQRRGLFR